VKFDMNHNVSIKLPSGATTRPCRYEEGNAKTVP
jgi:hypothetical protein